ncbi:translation initiation factor IF-2 [Phaeovibrio sulfidiphilus]|uniref:Translation initiation factor IF-2 n=1 Tax=Phaeovibrio sulfidiphilus TaxID=1220600 RepID=A0A8J6YHG7_9PROT|nr:translation initiation factor IF-2 [Phaeovibrio sulfidiphilus]MBE1236381.1 translation initiation factor IF-2 [Phaeovibrio sulfidiphilus]
MTNDKDRKAPLSLSSRGTLERSGGQKNQVRQTLGQGQSRNVTVESKTPARRRRAAKPDGNGDSGSMQAQAARKSAPRKDGGLTVTEQETRLRVLEEAARRRTEELARKEEEARAAARLQAEQEENARRAAEEEARNARLAAEAAAAAPPAPEPVVDAAPEARVTPEPEVAVPGPGATRVPPPVPGARAAADEDEDDVRPKKTIGRGAPSPKAPAATKRVEPKRRGKLTISAALSGEELAERARSMAAVRRAKQKERRKLEGEQQAQERVTRDVTIPEAITVQELANRMAERSANVIKCLMKMGVMATINQIIDADTAELVVAEFGHTAHRVSDADVELGLVDKTPDPEESLRPRPPVVTIMGHVDHGKTSMLDALRSTNVVSGEAGGITQHIGAYQVTSPSGQKITFIDTPGHAAFTAMRARGASVTDIVVLVVAANDGIMPQTVEAIRHAKAANVPIVVAINKVDLPEANPQKVIQGLLQHEIVTEEMGGDVQTVEVSAKKRINLEGLEEAILLQAEILDLKANPDHSAEGVVIEAKMEKGRGSVATVLVQRGTLKVGDIFVAGCEWGRVRALVDENGRRVHKATPAMPVEVLGFQGTPAAGDDFVVVEDENRAREVSEYRRRKEREAQQVRSARSTMEQMFEKIQAGEARELPVVIKADVQGSVEALSGTLEKIGNDDVKVRVLHAAVGGINESDITLAKASGAIVVAFNVRANPLAREMARRDNIEIRYHSIIYSAADEIKAMLTGMLEPTYKEAFIGYAEIREVFSVSRVGKVAGCMVTEGIVKRGAKVRLLRDNVVIHEGNLGQLRRFKDDVREVREGYECGISLENYNDIQKGDMIECFEMEEIAATL